jgi:hypothetical protein
MLHAPSFAVALISSHLYVFAVGSESDVTQRAVLSLPLAPSWSVITGPPTAGVGGTHFTCC